MYYNYFYLKDLNTSCAINIPVTLHPCYFCSFVSRVSPQELMQHGFL